MKRGVKNKLSYTKYSSLNEFDIKKSGSEQVLNEWLIQISQYDKLRFNEAQTLYKKALLSKNNDLRKEYMDKVILGTLYILYNYISRNELLIFSSSSYDMNDIINSFTEVWIKKIYDGELVNTDSYSSIINITFCNEVYKKLGGTKLIVNKTFGISTDIFVTLLYNYIKLKDKGIEFTLNDLIRLVTKDKQEYDYLIKECDFKIMSLFENIYSKLICNKNDNIDISINKINNFLGLLIDMGITESISEELLDSEDMEETVINNVLFETFSKSVDEGLKNDKQRQVIHKLYGLDDGNTYTLEEVAKLQNITRERVRQIEAKSLRLLRHPNRKMKMYI